MTVLKDLPLPEVALDYPFERSWAPEPGKPFEVAPDVFWLRMPIPISLDHINLWLLKDGDGWVIVDSGVDDSSCKAVWETVFATFCSVEQVNKIIVTHFHMDHIGLASWLALKCDCDVYMTQGEFDRYHSIVTRDEMPLVRKLVVIFTRLALIKRPLMRLDAFSRLMKNQWRRAYSLNK